MDVFAGSVEPETGERDQSIGEEIANSVTHGVGALAALAILPVLVVHSLGRGAGGRSLVGAAVFGSSVFLLYLGSTLYHALPQGRFKRAFRIACGSVRYTVGFFEHKLTVTAQTVNCPPLPASQIPSASRGGMAHLFNLVNAKKPGTWRT